MNKIFKIKESELKQIIENTISKEEQDKLIQFRIKYEHDVIGSEDYSIFKDPRARALMKSLWENGDNVHRLGSISPGHTGKQGLNVYGIDDDKNIYIVGTVSEIQRLNPSEYPKLREHYYDFNNGYHIYKIKY